MKQFFITFLIAALYCFNTGLFAQNLQLTTTNPDALFVCGNDGMSVNVANSGANPVNNILLTINFPVGVEYVPGTVSGANENNIGNLSAPVFSISSIAVGASTLVQLNVQAVCGLIDEINSGQQFSNTIVATYNGGSDQITSLFYPIETGLVVIESVNPVSQAGERGQVLQRIITVENTRLGPIQNLTLTDLHFPGYTGGAPGAASASNPSPVWFQAEYGGAFFSSFGDGDQLFEYQEELTLIETITITDCGTPSFDNPSLLRVGWSCNSELCQYDSANAEVTILPSTQNPDLRFITDFGHPVNFCGDVATTSTLTIINDGNVQAENVQIDLNVFGIPGSSTGFVGSSFATNLNGGAWSPISPNVSNPITLEPCSQEALGRALLTIPVVPPMDTVILRFDALSCSEICKSEMIPFYGFTFYTKQCPDNEFDSDSIAWRVDTSIHKIKSLIEYDIEGCIEDGSSHPMAFTVQTPRLLIDTGFLQLTVNFPIGLTWDENCGTPTVEGQTPVFFNETTNPDGTTTVTASYQLPFLHDSVAMEFCTRFDCSPSMTGMGNAGMWDPEGSVTTIYPLDCDTFCGLTMNAFASLTEQPDTPLGCGFMSCTEYKLFVENLCGAACGGGGGGGGGGFPAAILVTMDTYRINYGLEDNDDDRQADSNNPPELSLINRDRYIPGDTIRTDIKGVVILGSVGNFSFRLYHEAMSSDFGIADGDPWAIGAGRLIFTNKDSIQWIGTTLRIKKASGAESTCPVVWNPAAYAHQRFADVQNPNVSPPEIIDQFITMYREHNIPVLTCSPDGQAIEVGDSIFITIDVRINPNFVPLTPVIPPPLINFRTSLGEGEFAWRVPPAPGPLSQYSGYVRTRVFPRHTIRPCSTSLQQTPFGFGIRLARGNMFPYEVRQIAEISRLEWTIPAEVDLISALSDLTLQEATPWLVDENTSWTKNGNVYNFDLLNDVFGFPIDEGFEVSTDFLFDRSCSYIGPDTTETEFDVTYPVAFPGNTVQTNFRRDGTGMFDALPQLVPQFNDTILDLGSPEFEIDYVLRNTKPAAAPNAWLYIEPLNGNIDDVEVLFMPQQTPAPGVAGLYQLGDIPLFGQVPMRIRAKNNNCGALLLRLVFGWNCEPVNSPEGAFECARDTVILDLRLGNAVLELDIVDQPESVPLCEPSDYFEFEISNANDGNAFNLKPSIKLPQGLEVYASSSQVSYPSNGGSWASVPDPIQLPGNIYQWNLANILPALTQGLPSFEEQPYNAFSIRFRALATCGFVANAQPIYGVEGNQPCGTFTNVLRKPGDPIQLEGVSAPYNANISLSPVSTNPVGCGGEFEILTQIQLEGAPGANDSIYITLPSGVSYVDGSYTVIQNSVAGPPQEFGQLIQLAIQPGLAAGSFIKFSFKVVYDDPAGCIDKFIIAQTRQATSGFCALINQTCTVYIATGEALLPVPTQNPDLVLAQFTPTSTGASSFDFTAVIENPGAVSANSLTLQIWLDLNNNQQVDGLDQLVQTFPYNQAVVAGGSLTVSGSLNIPLEDLCKLLVVLPAEENCACGPKVFPLEGVTTATQVIARCEVEEVSFGVLSTAGHTYSWQPVGLLNCNDCAQVTYTPGPNVAQGDVITFVLIETAGDCSIEHRFEVRFGEVLGIQTPDQTICRGDSAVIEASPGGSYQWSGPGVNPSAQTQILYPTATTTYSVTVTLADGCTGTDQVTVQVIEPSFTDMGVVEICQGSSADIFGEEQTVPGEYCKVFTKSNGCDSTVCVTLRVYGTSGTSEAFLCEGDSLMVFDEFVGSAGEYCKVFLNPAGCDSTHCVTVSLVDSVALTPIDSVIISQGDTIQLSGPSGFASYLWSPAEGLSCTDCQNPLAYPTETMDYLLTVTNDNGCTGELIYHVVVFPPCFSQLQFPNAFTPQNGDEINDTFKPAYPDEVQGFEIVKRITVWSRWGQKVYDSTTKLEWDGLVDGKPAPVDVYICYFEIECQGEIRRIGPLEVTLLR